MTLQRDGLMTSVNILRSNLPNYCKMLVQKKWEEMKVSIMEAIENLAKAG